MEPICITLKKLLFDVSNDVGFVYNIIKEMLGKEGDIKDGK